MSIRKTLAAVAVLLAAAIPTMTAMSATAEAGGKRAAKAPAAKAAPARAHSCPLADMLKAKRERMASRMHHRAAKAAPAKPAKPMKVAKAAKAPKK